MKMPEPAILFEALLFLALACVLALFGAGIPIHFRAMAPGLLVEAGRGSETLENLSALYLDAGKIGPVDLFRKGGNLSRYAKTMEERRKALLERNPQYALSGGPAPYFEQFLSLLSLAKEEGEPADVISFIIPRERREQLLGFLRFSSNTAVQTLLAARSLNTTTRFLPVSSPAGSPLEATILMTALLLQGNHFTPEMNREIKAWGEAAGQGNRPAVDLLETFFLNMLSLGKRLNWVQLYELVDRLPDSDALASTAAAFREYPKRMPLFYTLVLTSGDPSGILRYLEKFGEKGWRGLSFALTSGSGALHALIKSNKRLYRPPLFVQVLDRMTEWVRQAPLLNFTLHHSQAAINLKILVILAAGYAVALFLSDLLEATIVKRTLSRRHPLVVTRNSIIALFFATTLWVFMEPTLFAGGPEPKAQLRLIFNIPNNLPSLKSQNLAVAMLDQITILILLIFFLLQLIVYVFCLIKISELKRQSHAEALKLKLLENEENLFDLGLYVGLGGTVASLILLAMDIVQASLIAAYSSTLFGIIFVALLKVIHVRPYRRSLILTVHSSGHESAPAHHHR